MSAGINKISCSFTTTIIYCNVELLIDHNVSGGVIVKHLSRIKRLNASLTSGYCGGATAAEWKADC